MPSASYLRQKGSRFHFRRRVPYHLREKVGREEIRVSLGTGDRRSAEARARKVWLAVDEVFGQAEGDVTVSREEIATLLTRATHDFEWADEIRLARHGQLFDHRGDAPPDADALVLSVFADEYRDALTRNDILSIRSIVADYARRLDRPIAENSIDEKLIGRALLRLLAERCDETGAAIEADIRRRNGAAIASDDRWGRQSGPAPNLIEPLSLEAVDTPSLQTPPPSLAPSSESAPPTSKQAVTFNEAWQNAEEDQIARNVWRRGDAAHAASSRKLFVDIVGDKRLSDIEKSDAVLFRKTSARLPQNYHRAREWRDLSAVDIVALADQSDAGSPNKIARMATKTVNRHISQLHTMWKTFAELGDIDVSAPNPFAKLHTNIRKSRTAIREERDQFTVAEMKVLFASPVWTGCKSAARRKIPGPLTIRDWKFWIPLIGSHSGMRREEICALQVCDIEQVEGIWIVNLRKAKQRLKTRGAERYVPIHDTLLKIGFIEDLVAGRRPDEWLFPDLEPTEVDDRHGEPFGKWFTPLRKDLKIYRPEVVFHSFRHTVSTALFNAEAYPPFITEITGHEDDQRTSEIERYKKEVLVPNLKKTIDLLDYGIDFSFLFRERRDRP